MTDAAPPPLDVAALGRFLEANLPGFRGPLRAEKFAGGQSNPTYRLHAESGLHVLRRKPSGQLLKSAHAIDREFRVMRALRDTPVPVPRVDLLVEDEGVIGTAFYVMEHVEGRIFWDPALPGLARDERAAIYDAMNAALAHLHGVDAAAVGLGDYGRPGNYYARQIARWGDQYRASETEAIPAMDALIAWLGANVPPDDGRVALVHGDYRIDNMIFHASEPRILAILDWELSTLGHPFADLAYQCMQWRLPNAGDFRGLGGVDRAALGLPREEDYVRLYCARAGIAGIDDWTFYLAFSFFRIAAILQGVLKRAIDGNASNPERAFTMGRKVPMLAGMAMRLVEGR